MIMMIMMQCQCQWSFPLVMDSNLNDSDCPPSQSCPVILPASGRACQ
jgi:hypothetical protein